MVINRNAQRYFCLILADNVFIQLRFYLLRFGQIFIGIFNPCGSSALIEFLFNNCLAKLHAFVAYKHALTGNQFLNLFLTLVAKRTKYLPVFSIVVFRHLRPPYLFVNTLSIKPYSRASSADI